MVDVFEQRLVLPEEIPLLNKLRNEIGQKLLEQAPPEVSSDIGLLRFLRGYMHESLSAAATAFKNGVEWRKKHNSNHWRSVLVLNKNPEDCSFNQIVSHYTDFSRLPHWDKVGLAYPERFFHGHDKHGNPVWITTRDMIENVFLLLTVINREDYDNFRVARMVNQELYLDALSRHLKRLVKCVFVWDLDGMTRALWKTWENKCVKTFWGDWDHEATVPFPEQAHRIAAVNVPGWLMVIWKMVKTIVPGRTLRKVNVVGTTGLSDALLKQCEIPASSLPVALGGTCTINYFARPRELSDFRMGSLEIPAGSTRSIEFDCSTGGHVYWGVFVHGGKDIVAKSDAVVGKEKAIFNGPGGTVIKIEEFYRDTYVVPDRFSETKLRLQFDNRSSIFFSKTIEFVFAPFPDVFHDVKSSISLE